MKKIEFTLKCLYDDKEYLETVDYFDGFDKVCFGKDDRNNDMYMFIIQNNNNNFEIIEGVDSYDNHIDDFDAFKLTWKL